MFRLKRFLILCCANLAIFILLSELVFTAYYYIEDGKYLSVTEKLAAEKSSFDVEKQKTISCNKYNNILVPHPYLVFVHTSRPECKSYSNNTGHRGPDVPLTHNPDNYTVMILGGSVANQLFQFKADEIRDYFAKKHPKKNIVILNGSLEGWKQPQQLFMLQLYGDVIDAAISIEGYNEMMFNYRLGYNLRFDTPFLPGYRKANPGFQSTQERMAIDISTWLFDMVNNNRLLRQSKTAYFISDKIRSGLEQGISDGPGTAPLENSLAHLEKILSLPSDLSKEEKKQYAIQQYIKYLSLMNATAKAYGIPLAVFLQPAPALYKPLTADEKTIVGDLDYRDDYVLFEKTLLTQNKALPVYSLLDVFAHSEDTIYKDGIHYYRESSGPSLVMQRIYQTLDKQHW